VADFSLSPSEVLKSNRDNGYVGLHIEQGVPILDRDLNLLQDLINATVRDVVTRYIGNGSPAGQDGFGIGAPPSSPADQVEQNFAILAGATGPGRCLVGGLEVVVPAATTYRAQAGVPSLTKPAGTEPDPRTDTVYLDVFLVEVDARDDHALANAADIGLQTSVRLKPAWVVRVAENAGQPPNAPDGHAHTVLAELRRPRDSTTITASMITDKRQRGLTVSDMERRLRRVETALVPAFVGSQFTPKSGGVGDAVTVTGTNFNVGGVIVRFGEVVAPGVAILSAIQLSAGVPRGIATDGVAVPVFISVENAAGRTFAGSPFTVTPVPAFAAPGSQFSPANGNAGATVTLNGFNFNVTGLSVKFGAVTATVTAANARQIQVQVPPGLVTGGATSTNVKITVATDQGTVVSDDDFRAEQAVPAPAFVTSGSEFTPRNGTIGDQVTLNGTNFNTSPVVFFGTVQAALDGAPTATVIKVKVPSGVTPPGTPKAVRISVTTPGGTATSSVNYTVS